MPTRYELFYIIPATLTDEEVGAVEAKVSALLTKHGAEIESTKRLGKFRLAYPIKHQRHGHYVLILLSIERPAIAKIEELLRITPEVLRHLLLRADEAGADQKFELVQFVEVNVEQRDDRRRRERMEAREAPKPDEALKSGVAALEKGVSGEEENKEEKKEKLSSEELEKKIESALSDDIKDL